MSSADTGFYYVAKKNSRTMTDKLVKKKYDPVARTPSYAPGSVMEKIAGLEARASSCNGGCASSFRHGNEPWIGCSESGGGLNYGPFSPTCRDTITHTSYENCVETKVFLGEFRNRAHWFCSSLQAGNRFKVADLKRPERR